MRAFIPLAILVTLSVVVRASPAEAEEATPHEPAEAEETTALEPVAAEAEEAPEAAPAEEATDPNADEAAAPPRPGESVEPAEAEEAVPEAAADAPAEEADAAETEGGGTCDERQTSRYDAMRISGMVLSLTGVSAVVVGLVLYDLTAPWGALSDLASGWIGPLISGIGLLVMAIGIPLWVVGGIRRNRCREAESGGLPCPAIAASPEGTALTSGVGWYF